MSLAVAGQRHSLLQALQSLLYILVVALFIIAFTAQPFRIPSASMEPTLLVGDFLLVDKDLSTGHSFVPLAPDGVIRRSDLIVFHYPVNPSRDLVKRVVGLPGDRLRLEDGRVYIDERALAEPYAVFRAAPPESYRDDFPRMDRADPGVDSRWWIEMHTLVRNGELAIPPDSYFVLGDNRNDSEDSRYWGLVPRDAVVGKPFLIYFSMNSPGNGPALAPGQSGDSVPPVGRVRRRGAVHSLFRFSRWDRALSIPR